MRAHKGDGPLFLTAGPARKGAVPFFVASLLAAACASGPPRPAPLDTATETCRHCRMAVSDQRFAAQIAAPGEEPVFFDDVGCLGAYVAAAGQLPRGAVAYVADHRTREWVPADRASYTRLADLDTPMGSHLVAHADAASREADPVARRGVSVHPREIFGPSGAPGGAP